MHSKECEMCDIRLTREERVCRVRITILQVFGGERGSRSLSLSGTSCSERTSGVFRDGNLVVSFEVDFSEGTTSSCHLHDAFTVVTVGCLVQLPEMNETLFVSFRILLHFCFILSKFSFFVSFSRKNCFILLHSCFILLPSCFILFHSSFIPHSACFILLQSCFILFHSLPARFSSHSICFILLGQYFNGLNFSK